MAFAVKVADADRALGPVLFPTVVITPSVASGNKPLHFNLIKCTKSSKQEGIILSISASFTRPREKHNATTGAF